MADRLERVLVAIDAANAEDPVVLETEHGPRPKELVHAEAMTRWLWRLDPEADEHQQIAARAHHFRRWTVPRDTYPEGRAGYLRWRRDRKAQHAEEVGALLAEHGYASDEIETVAAIIRKQGMGSDVRVQTHEDALCLVFMELQLVDLAGKLGPEKAPEVLAKTVAKMSERGRKAAAGLGLEPGAMGMVTAALDTVDRR